MRFPSVTKFFDWLFGRQKTPEELLQDDLTGLSRAIENAKKRFSQNNLSGVKTYLLLARAYAQSPFWRSHTWPDPRFKEIADLCLAIASLIDAKKDSSRTFTRLCDKHSQLTETYAKTKKQSQQTEIGAKRKVA